MNRNSFYQLYNHLLKLKKEEPRTIYKCPNIPVELEQFEKKTITYCFIVGINDRYIYLKTSDQEIKVPANIKKSIQPNLSDVKNNTMSYYKQRNFDNLLREYCGTI